jgi:hypothetical protein
MVKTKIANLARMAPAFALLSCAAPKAIVVESAPASPRRQVAVESMDSVPGDLPLPDDGIRLPEDMLAMPGDGEFRATSPNAIKSGGEASAVIARPPTDPPSRPKPKDPGAE